MNSLQTFHPFLDRGDFSELYLEESQALSIRWEEGRVDAISSSKESGVGLRFLQKGETHYGHMDMARPFSGIIESADRTRLSRLKDQISNQLTVGKPRPFRTADSKSHNILKSPLQIPLQEKIGYLERAFKAAGTGPHIRQININYGEKLKKVGILNSDGDVSIEDRVYVVLSLLVTVERNNDLQTAYEALGGLIGLELFDGEAIERMAVQVGKRAHDKLNAPQAPIGEMPVLISSSAGGTLIHEAVGHSLEADAVLEGTSPSYLGKLGRVVANEKLTIYDDPTVPFKRGSFHFDDEGVPSEPSKLIENGVLKDYMFDRLSAEKAGRRSNGHGRRESYAHRPIPRMSNTFIAPGPDNPEEILRSFQNGLLVTKMGGGQVNTANGDFVFEVEEGFHVKDGKKTLVRGATLLGNGPDVLMNIDQVGSDHGWAIGTCGKEGQGVPVSDAVPTIRIKKLVVGGQ